MQAYSRWPHSKNSHQRRWLIPNLKVNDMQLQTANLVYIFDEIILSVTASKNVMMTIIEPTSFPL